MLSGNNFHLWLKNLSHFQKLPKIAKVHHIKKL